MSKLVKKHGERIPQEKRDHISMRYHTLTKAINKEFWDSESDISHTLYVGSYGRNTAVETSDIDILAELPYELLDQYNSHKGNGQSRLLQAVRGAILNAYPESKVRADGQVVKIDFSDGMRFEIVPAFKSLIGIYMYPDSNDGGKWRSTNPKAEQDTMAEKNKICNGLLYDICRHIRFIRDSDFSSYHLSGIVIDSFVYDAIEYWRWADDGDTSSQPPGSYEQSLLNYYNLNGISYGMDIHAPGSGDAVNTESSYECLGKVLNSMAC